VSLFEGLCGFRPLDNIAQNLRDVPELHAVVGADAAQAVCSAVSAGQEEQHEALRKAFSALMNADQAAIATQTDALVQRLRSSVPPEAHTDADRVVLSAHTEFPGDVGLLSVYMLNFVRLEPGQAIFLKPNLPHAYLQGDCMELMATSDNVVSVRVCMVACVCVCLCVCTVCVYAYM
jgi:mannose-6-phosphate isomerase